MGNHGGQWKTSWRRREQYGTGQPVTMWFIDTADGYQAALDVPWPMQSTSWWVGMVLASPAAIGPAYCWVQQGQLGAFSQWSTTTADNVGGANIDSFSIDATLDVLGLTTGQTEQYAPIGSVRVDAVHVAMYVLDYDGVNSTMSVYMDGALRARTVQAAAAAAPVGGPTFGVQSGNNMLNGFAAGTTVPTAQQISDWFYAVKMNGDIQEIPGITTDLISASAVQPLAPDPMPNQGTGQDFALLGGNPTNIQRQVYFLY